MLKTLCKTVVIFSFLLNYSTAVANNFTHQNVDKALDILEKVVEHHGGEEAISNVDNILVDYDYSINYRTQGYGYQDTDYHSNRPGNAYSLISYDEKLAWTQNQSYYMKSFTANTSLFKDGKSTEYNNITSKFSEKSYSDFNTEIEHLVVRNPVLILKAMLKNKDSLRYIEKPSNQQRSQLTLTTSLGTKNIFTVYIDTKKYQISRIERVKNNEIRKVYFSDYKKINDFILPFTIKQDYPESFYSKYYLHHIDSYNFNPDVEKIAMTPTGYSPEEERNTYDGKLRLQSLGNNIYWVTRNGNNTIFVEFSDHIMAVDAFGYKPEDMKAKIAKMREVIPVKPIKYVSISHHHNDHIHEVPFYTKNNTTIITAEAFKPQLIERIANAEVSKNLTPKFDIVNKKRTYADKTQHIEIYELKNMLHAETMLMTYFPKEQLIYFPDLYEEGYLIENQRGVKSLLAEIKALNLRVKGFIPAHDNEVHSLEKIKATLANPIGINEFRRQPHQSVTHSE